MARLGLQLPWNVRGGLRDHRIHMHGLHCHNSLPPFVQPILQFSGGCRNQCGKVYKLHVIHRVFHLQYVLRLSIPALIVRLEEVCPFQPYLFPFVFRENLLQCSTTRPANGFHEQLQDAPGLLHFPNMSVSVGPFQLSMLTVIAVQCGRSRSIITSA
jgi:hypothetical protein